MRNTILYIMLLSVTCLSTAVGWHPTALAQAAPSQYLHEVWTTENGLPQNTVMAITQTRDGYLWIGTFGGLARFDGVKFTVFNTSNSPGLKSNRILSLFEDRAGALWVGTEQGGLSRYYQGTFTTYTTKDGLPDNFIYSMAEDREGHLWVATNNGLARFVDRRFTTYTMHDGLVDNRVILVGAGRDDSLWIVSANGLTRWQAGRLSTYPLPADINFRHALTISEGHDGYVWIACRWGLTRFRDGTFTFYPRQPQLSHFARVSIFEDRAGETRFVMSNQPAGFEGERVIKEQTIAEWGGTKAIIEDREGNIWMGSGSEGLHCFKAAQVTAYAAENGLSDDGFFAITGDGAEGLWLSGPGFIHFRAERFIKYPGATGYWALLQDRQGNLWLGNYEGLHRFKDGRWTSYPREPLLKGYPVAAIYEDRAGNLWVGTGSDGELGGLFRFQDGIFTPYRPSEGFTLTDVRFITEDRRRALWIGGANGMSRYKDGMFTNYTTEQGLSHNYVRDIYEDADGVLWIGTYGGGLNRFKDGKFTPITTKNGLYDDIVSRILEDANGNFWMSCNRGIYRTSRKELNDFADGRVGSITCIAYGVADGMKTNETNGGSQPAGWKAADGKLWFPTIRGVAVIDPNKLNPLPPPVAIEQVLIGKTAVDPRQKIEVRPGQGDLEIHYTGLSFVAPEKVHFKYKLEGYDKDWIEAGTRRVAYYTNTAPGTYTFRVAASNNDGVWSTQDASMAIVVIPPFWRTWWFLTLAVLGVAGVAILIYERRVSLLKRAHAAQEAFSQQLITSQENERKRIAAELHDSLGQNLLIIKHTAQFGLNMAGDRASAIEQLSEISEMTSQVLEEVREIAYNLRPYHIDRLGLTDALDFMLQRVAQSSAIHFATDIDQIDGLLSKEAEMSLYRIVQECVNNIIKHSSATEATVSIKRDDGGLQLTIQDNGQGFEVKAATAAESRQRGFGLTGIAERVRILGGKEVIHSVPGQGTIITITINLQDGRDER